MKQLVIFFLAINFLIADYANTRLIRENCKGEEYALCLDTIRNHKAENDYVDIDWELIEKVYLDLCKIPYAKACQILGNLYTYNSIKAIKVNLEKSAMYNTKACVLNDMVACNNLGVMYKYGKFYKKNYKKALELFRKSCNDKDHSAVHKACRSKNEIILILKGNL